MDEEQTTSVEEPSHDADAEPSGPSDPSETSDGYRPPRWAWFALGGLAVMVIAMGAAAADRDLLFEDDFSTSGVLGRWLEDENASGSMGYEEETYHIGVNGKGSLGSLAELPGRPSAIRVGVDAGMVSRTGGLSVSCIAGKDGEEFYDFVVVAEEGAVAIIGSEQLDPLATASTGLLHEGMNRVEVECTGASATGPAELALSINGTPILEHEEPQGIGSFSAVGLSVFGPEGPAEAAFDNIEVAAA